MTPTTNDTLDIGSIHPGSRPNAAGTLDDNDPDAATSARNLIASLGQAPAAAPVADAQSVPHEAAPATAPAHSPAAEALTAGKVKPIAAAKARLGNHELPSPVRPIASAIGSFLLLFVLFKSQIIFSQIGYLTGKSHNPAAISAQLAASQTTVSADPTISIPKINVNAPVVYEPSINENDILKALQNGIVHYGTTPAPGQGGNAVFVGHSSNDWWEAGNYKFVFVLLDKLVVGDKFSLNYQSHKYVYEVTSASVVAPTDVGVLAPSTQPEVTLITCTPPGTSWKRLVIVAKQISPAPTTSTVTDASTAADQPLSLPGNAPSLTSQLSRAWSNITSSIGGLFGSHKGATTPQPAPTTAAPTPAPTAAPSNTPADTLPLAK